MSKTTCRNGDWPFLFAAARGVFVALLLAMATGHAVAASGAEVTGLRCEYLANPLGLDVLQPRLNWRLASDRRGERQTAYRVIVASSPKRLDKDQGDLWDSGKVNSDQSLQVEYARKPLGSEQHCYWKVRVWDKDGGSSPWSPPAFWTMGLLAESDWKAKWIGLDGGDQGDGSEHRRLPARHLRREFRVEKKIAQATAYICGLGFFELYLNGCKVSDHVMDPSQQGQQSLGLPGCGGRQSRSGRASRGSAPAAAPWQMPVQPIAGHCGVVRQDLAGLMARWFTQGYPSHGHFSVVLKSVSP